MTEHALYLAGLACGLVWVASWLLGDAIDILAWAAFGLVIVAIVTDKQIKDA